MTKWKKVWGGGVGWEGTEAENKDIKTDNIEKLTEIQAMNKEEMERKKVMIVWK